MAGCQQDVEIRGAQKKRVPLDTPEESMRCTPANIRGDTKRVLIDPHAEMAGEDDVGDPEDE